MRTSHFHIGVRLNGLWKFNHQVLMYLNLIQINPRNFRTVSNVQIKVDHQMVQYSKGNSHQSVFIKFKSVLEIKDELFQMKYVDRKRLIEHF